MSEPTWDRIRQRLFGPDGLFATNQTDEAAFAECEQICAEKDLEIERLKEAIRRMEQWKRCAVGTMDEADETEASLRLRIAQMAALLDKVPHSHQNAPIPRSLAMDNDTDWQCVYFKDCPACAWAAMKSALDWASEDFPTKDKQEDEQK